MNICAVSFKSLLYEDIASCKTGVKGQQTLHRPTTQITGRCLPTTVGIGIKMSFLQHGMANIEFKTLKKNYKYNFKQDEKRKKIDKKEKYLSAQA